MVESIEKIMRKTEKLIFLMPRFSFQRIQIDKIFCLNANFIQFVICLIGMTFQRERKELLCNFFSVVISSIVQGRIGVNRGVNTLKQLKNNEMLILAFFWLYSLLILK